MEQEFICQCHQDSWADRGALAEHRAEELRRQLQATEIKNAHILLKTTRLEEMIRHQPTRLREVKRSEKECRARDRTLKRKERDLRRDEEEIRTREEAASRLEARLHDATLTLADLQ